MKKILLALILCFIATTANAKLTMNGAKLEDLHIDTIKGHLYLSLIHISEPTRPY